VTRTIWTEAAAVAPSPPRRIAVRLGRRTFLALLLAALAWPAAVLVGPTQLGGPTTLVTVDGTSMLPRFQPSDLVVLGRASAYHVGEVVGYRSSLLHRIVMHRIVRIEAGRYVFRGDNNSFLDPERPTRAQLVGRVRLRVPWLGRAVALFKRPLVPALVAAIAVLGLGLPGSRRR
jgi:signal peptidase I